jgi:hypothetical protein
MVSEFRPDGTPHPHAGKTGVITRLLDPSEEERENTSLDEPKFGMVKLDDGIPPKNFICVSLDCLDTLTKWGRPKSFTARNPIPRNEALGIRVSRPLTRIVTQEFPAFAAGLQTILGRVNTMTEGRREPKKCSFCGLAECRLRPMFTKASASICLQCATGFCHSYLLGTVKRRVLHEARVLAFPPSRWRRTG